MGDSLFQESPNPTLQTGYAINKRKVTVYGGIAGLIQSLQFPLIRLIITKNGISGISRVVPGIRTPGWDYYWRAIQAATTDGQNRTQVPTR